MKCDTPIFTEPGARRVRARSHTPRKAHQGPRLPCDIERNQILAKRRVEDLQRIFTSHHSAECSQLRERLGALDEEADQLRKWIVELEQQQRALFLQPSAAGEGGEGADKDATKDANHDRLSGGPSVDEDSDERKRSMRVRRPGLSMGEDERKNHQEALNHQLEQTAKMQEGLIEELQAEVRSLELQSAKEEKWVKKLEGEVLDTEITKVRYRVRLESANARNEDLSELLKGAYEKMSQLLKARVLSKEESAKNDAILQYLQDIFKSNEEQAQNFVDNRDALKQLMSQCQHSRHLRDSAIKLSGRMRQEEELVDSLVLSTDDLSRKLEMVQSIWMTIPAEVKSSVALQEEAAAFKAKRASVHPLNAIRGLRDHVQYINSKLQNVRSQCQVLLDNSPVMEGPAPAESLAGSSRGQDVAGQECEAKDEDWDEY